jgi:hypothetical protein
MPDALAYSARNLGAGVQKLGNFIYQACSLDVSDITIQDAMQTIVSNSWFAFRPRD